MPGFSINFDNVEELELPEEGNYTLKIHDYKTAEAAKEESRAKGFNIRLQFKLSDHPELDNLIVYHNLWVQRENPFAAMAFFEALLGEGMEGRQLDEEYVSDPSNFLGLEVGAFVSHDTYETKSGKTRRKLAITAFDDFYSVS